MRARYGVGGVALCGRGGCRWPRETCPDHGLGVRGVTMGSAYPPSLMAGCNAGLDRACGGCGFYRCSCPKQLPPAYDVLPDALRGAVSPAWRKLDVREWPECHQRAQRRGSIINLYEDGLSGLRVLEYKRLNGAVAYRTTTVSRPTPAFGSYQTACRAGTDTRHATWAEAVQHAADQVAAERRRYAQS